MTYEIQAMLVKERHAVNLSTEDPQRAATFAKALQTSRHYSDVVVVMGTKRLNYSDFIQQLKDKVS